FPPGTLLGGRYEVAELLGQGGNGMTYLCRDTDRGHDVAVKCLSLRRQEWHNLRDWKQLDLFEREAAVLRSLEHPGIPRYLACFEQDAERDRAFFLVQEAVQGASLAAMVRSGWRPDEAEVARIAAELLRTLQYLDSRRPPVVHRDVKPENIVVEGGTSGGRVFLVDFGAVQAAAAGADDVLSGSTVVGTFGYMAPEQLRGAASPACDLYGLGATLLFLLSGHPPTAFHADRLRLDLSSVRMGPRLGAVVEGLLEPTSEERMAAEEALAILEGQRLPAWAPGGADAAAEAAIERRQPGGSRVVVKKHGACLEVVIPPKGCDYDCWIVPWVFWFWAQFVLPASTWLLGECGPLALLLVLPAWAMVFVPACRRFCTRERVIIGRRSWRIERQLALGGKAASKWREGNWKTWDESGPVADLKEAATHTPALTMQHYQVVLRDREREDFGFGEALGEYDEPRWLREVINEHLREIRARPHEF
ncbi:hypothetical protein ABPG75_004785, partial [Micractinium tetrahymenae]